MNRFRRPIAKFLLFLFLLCKLTVGRTQDNLLNLSFGKTFSIGSSIMAFKGQLSCSNNTSFEIADLEGRFSCKSFRYLPADKDSFPVGNIKFRTVILTPDSLKQIKGADLINSYLATDSTDPKKLSALAFRELEAHISSSLQIKSKKYKPEYWKTRHYIQRGLTWEKRGTRYTLLETRFRKKRAGQKLTHLVMLSYYKVG